MRHGRSCHVQLGAHGAHRADCVGVQVGGEGGGGRVEIHCATNLSRPLSKPRLCTAGTETQILRVCVCVCRVRMRVIVYCTTYLCKYAHVQAAAVALLPPPHPFMDTRVLEHTQQVKKCA